MKPVSEFVVVYCHGERKIARYIGNGYAICPCGQKLRVVTEVAT